jgi:hypothetical protein
MRVIEDILLSERDSGGRSKKKGYVSCGKKASASRVAKWHTRKYMF